MTNFKFHLSLLGKFTAVMAAEQSAPALRRKTRAILAYLAANPQPHTRQALMDLFCQDAQSPTRALSLLLTRVRRHLDATTLITDSNVVQFNTQAAWVDYALFQQQLSGDLSHKNAADLETAVTLYRGEFLEGLSLPDAPEFELWLLGQRAHARHLLERGLLALIQQLSENGDYDTAVTHARQLLQHNPLLEEAHAQLIWLYAQTGQRDAALRQYEQCRALLQSELAVDPAPELQEMHRQIAAGTLGRAAPTIAPLPTAGTHRVTAHFVGRQAELSALQAAWQAAGNGTAQIVLLDGPAGSGKTQLMRVLMNHLPQNTAHIGHCYESTMALPYQPWHEILTSLLTGWDAPMLAQLPLFVRLYLARLLPERAEHFAVETAVFQPIGADERGQLVTAVFDFLSRAASNQSPRLLFIDDLQWADEASLHLFSTVALRLSRQPILLIGTLRRNDADRPLLSAILHDLARRQAVRLRLEPLPAEAVAELVQQLWPQLPVGYRTHVVPLLMQATGGNAFFVTELLAELSQADQLPQEMPIPPSVRELVSQRLQRLSRQERQVLEALAVLNIPATRLLVQQVSARSEEETVAAIEDGQQQGLLRAVSRERPFTYEFGHDLVRAAVVALVSDARLELLHRRAAQQLTLTGVPPALLAYHWDRAGNTAQAVIHLTSAGQAAAAMYAYADAIAYFQRALVLMTDGAAEKTAVMQQLGDCWQKTGEIDAAETIYLAAYEQATAGNSPIQAQIAAGLGQLYLDKADYPAAELWLDKALTGEAQLAHADRIRALDGLATLHARQGNLNKAVPLAMDALQQARAQQNDVEAVYCLGTLGAIFNQTGEYGRALAVLAEGMALAESSDNQPGLARCLSNRASVRWYMGDLAASLDDSQQALAIEQRTGHQHGIARQMGNMGLTYLWMDEFEAALTHMEQALALEKMLGNKEGMSRNIGNIALVHHRQEAYAQAVPYILQALELEKEMNSREGMSRNYSNLGIVYHHMGQYEDALAALHACWTLITPLENPTWLANTLMNMGLVYGRIGQFEAALTCYFQALQLFVEQQLKPDVARTLGNMGRLFWLQGAVDTAVSWLQRAVALGQQLASQQDLSLDVYSLATAQAGQQNWEAALSLAAESLQMAQQVQRESVVQLAQLLLWCCEVAVGARSRSEALALMAARRQQATEPEDIAAVQFAMYQVDDGQVTLRKETAVLYQTLYQQSSNIEFNLRYQELTGTPLPLPSMNVMPPPVTAVSHTPDTLLSLVDEMIEKA
ncbi:MAG: tetratricopeptide repeat protein [Anaerolineales bacterium]|nr:tetratricopeptide repeat protein [Anaerolineales bacterium]MCB8991455.1 tetratricopeptide repeat protein [Ardenticatenaceae bacterium]MCB9003925.1 tetratricopeptide repeat protein [Ardenticatenaceae bacterium]